MSLHFELFGLRSCKSCGNVYSSSVITRSIVGIIESAQLSQSFTNTKLTVKYILNWFGLSVQATNESKRKFSSASNSPLQRILLLVNTYE